MEREEEEEERAFGLLKGDVKGDQCEPVRKERTTSMQVTGKIQCIAFKKKIEVCDFSYQTRIFFSYFFSYLDQQ